MKFKFFTSFKAFVFVLFFMTPVTAAPFVWHTLDVIRIPSRGISVSRPNDRWRVMEAQDYGLLNMVYHRHGDNVLIEIKEWPHFKVHKSYKFNQDMIKKKSSFRTKLLESYESEGYRFFDFEYKDRRILAIGTNASRQIVMLNFYFDQRQGLSNPVVIQMVVPRERYHEFRDDFFSVAGSVKSL